MAKALGKEASRVPFIVIGEEVFQGYDNEQGSGKEIQDRVNYCIDNECPDKAGEVLGYSKLAWSLASESSVMNTSLGYVNLSVSEAKKMLEAYNDASSLVILDVRTAEEYVENKIDPKQLILMLKPLISR